MQQESDIAIVGAGAAGLMAAISSGRSARESGSRPRIVLLDGAKRPGVKILVAGGGRCNVTHDVVDESAYSGSSRQAVRRVLGRFPVEDTVRFFGELGVELKREETGKLFPITDDAHTVLNALMRAAANAGVELVYPWRVGNVERRSDGTFRVVRAEEPEVVEPSEAESLTAKRLMLATGGHSLPKSGSDGGGYVLARSLGHTVTATFPALVPLTLPREHFLCALPGLTLPATLILRSATGKRLIEFTDSTLLTHFGLSGPSVLDISRYYLDAARGDGAELLINFVPGLTTEDLDSRLAEAGRCEGALTVVRFLTSLIPERLARGLCGHSGVDPGLRLASLSRDARRSLAGAVCALPLPVTGSRGFAHAEVTAGGIPLSEVHLDTMESRVCPGLYLVGEILDVDGRIGGYNFQWAWATGYVAGLAAGRAS